MLKAIFATKEVDTIVDEELERTLRSIYARMDRMLERDTTRKLKFNSVQTPITTRH